ncbi:unnamed protein product [Linum trigynum]|uniref:Uncharacterized protein n=1 Tax=Linum trigynum TaxID=586398 RepID=A0AAV2E4C6_9ROSI
MGRHFFVHSAFVKYTPILYGPFFCSRRNSCVDDNVSQDVPARDNDDKGRSRDPLLKLRPLHSIGRWTRPLAVVAAEIIAYPSPG